VIIGFLLITELIYPLIKPISMNKLKLISAHVQNLKMLICIFLTLLFSASLRAQTLVWEDNFNGTTLNSSMWSYDFGNGCNRGICGWGNAELEYYTSRPENVSVQNGSLIIEGRREAFGGSAFTSGRIKTEGRVHFKYGTLEARIKIPNLQNGLWPALWLLGETGNWPMNGEIDIMEMGHVAAISAGVVNRRVGGACHWDNNGYVFSGSSTDFPTNLNNDFHIYKLVWDATNVTCFVDNVQYFTMNITSADKTEFHIPHYLILNLAIGGNYTGITTAAGITAPLPARVEVDYVRLYQNPGSSLYLGANNAITGTYGIYTETTPVTSKVTYGADANLYLWNGLTPVATAAFEGSQVMSYNTAAGAWWGLGVATNYKNLSAFQPTGQLKFHMKTSSTETIGIGISTGHGDSWIDLVNGGNQYGLVRNGQWCAVSIPFSAFLDLDLFAVKQIFMMRGGAPAAAYSFAVDNIYYSGGGTANTPPAVSITSPANNATFTAPASIVINANASDPGGSVTSVAFYNGSTLLGTDTSSPYSFTWSNVAAGTYTLTARATDNGGLTTTSTAVSVTIGGTTSSNLALNKPVTVSSTENAGTPATAAVDGNAATRWSSIAADPQWIYVDLGANYNVNRVKITWEAALGKDYQVQIATATAGPWTTMRTVTGNAALVNDQTGLSGTGRYVRIYGTARGTQWGYSIFELEAYGTPVSTGSNLALNKPTTVSSTEAAGTPGSAAVDGNATSRWASAFSDPQWIYVDLGANYNVNRVKITWENALGKDYQVQIATASGGPWTTMKTIAGNTTLVNDHTGLAGTGRYVRMYGTARGTAYGYSIFELEVYGTSAGRLTINENNTDAAKIISYPNPASDLYFINGVTDGANVSIRNATGTTVHETKLKNGTIDISHLSSGVYIIDVRDGERSTRQRLVVK
jgi:beta-glucanase (GH16 family)